MTRPGVGGWELGRNERYRTRSSGRSAGIVASRHPLRQECHLRLDQPESLMIQVNLAHLGLFALLGVLTPVVANASSGAAVPSRGPSFDCKKASTKLERRICEVPELAELDARLDAAFGAARARDSTGAAALATSQQAWLSWRNRTCEGQDWRVAHCYKLRIAALEAEPAGAPVPLCRTFAERYMKWRGDRTGSGAAPFAFANSPSPGLVLAKPIAELPDTSREAFANWGSKLDPPLRFSESPFGASDRAYGVRVEQVPGARWFAASYFAGRLHCIHPAYFHDDAGTAVADHNPPSWDAEENANGCFVERAFATIDSVPVALEFGGYEDGSAKWVVLSRWNGSGFGPICQATFSFAREPRGAGRLTGFSVW